MNDSRAMGSALYGRLGTVQYTYSTSGGTATTTGTLGCYDTLAPQGTNPPYIVYQLLVANDLYTFGTVSGESAEYMVKVVSDRLDPSAQAYAIVDQVHAALQDAPLTITGGYGLRLRRTGREAPYRDNTQLWHVPYRYKIDRWNT